MAVDTATTVGSVSISGNDYPVYGSQDRATEYFNAHLNGSVFTDADFTDQQKALVMARRLIDRQDLSGDKTDDAQTTEFPRDGDTTVPVNVEIAGYELSILLLDDSDFFNQDSTGSNEKLLKAGPVTIEFFSSTESTNSLISGAAVFPPQVLDLLKDYLDGGTDLVSIPYAGGTENESNVVDIDEYDLAEGY